MVTALSCRLFCPWERLVAAVPGHLPVPWGPDSVDCVTGRPSPQLPLAGAGVELSVLEYLCCRDSTSRPPAVTALGPGQLMAPTVAPPLLAPSPTRTDWGLVLNVAQCFCCASYWTVTTHLGLHKCVFTWCWAEHKKEHAIA